MPATGCRTRSRSCSTSSAQYALPARPSTIAAFVRGDLQYRGDAFSDVRNRPEDHTDSYTLGNLHFGVELGRFEVTAFWRNVGDERGELVRFNGRPQRLPQPAGDGGAHAPDQRVGDRGALPVRASRGSRRSACGAALQPGRPRPRSAPCPEARGVAQDEKASEWATTLPSPSTSRAEGTRVGRPCASPADSADRCVGGAAGGPPQLDARMTIAAVAGA